MKKTLIAGLLATFLAAPASGQNLESLMKKPLSYWKEGVREFVLFSLSELPGKKFEVYPEGSGRMELLTGIAGSYGMSVRDIERLYQTAVKLAVRDALSHLNCQVSDPDIAFVMGEVSWQIESSCRKSVTDYIEKRKGLYLKQALEECGLLKISPLAASFLGSEGCRELLSGFSTKATDTLFEYLRNEEKELYREPEKVEEKNLKEIVETLKKSGIL